MRQFVLLILLVIGFHSSYGGVVTQNVRSLSKSGSTPLKGNVTLSEGTNITLNQSATNISISATASSAMNFGVSTTTVSLILTSSNSVVLGDASARNISVTLPASSANLGKIFFIKKIDTSGNVVTITGSASDTIDQEVNQPLSVQDQSATIISDGSTWYVF
jgi:hypothetical protein